MLFIIFVVAYINSCVVDMVIQMDFSNSLLGYLYSSQNYIRWVQIWAMLLQLCKSFGLQLFTNIFDTTSIESFFQSFVETHALCIKYTQICQWWSMMIRQDKNDMITLHIHVQIHIIIFQSWPWISFWFSLKAKDNIFYPFEWLNSQMQFFFTPQPNHLCNP